MAVKNLAAFNKAVRAFTKTMPLNELRIVHKKIAAEALARLVMKTPVRTGRARGNWQMSVGTPSLEVSDKTDKEGSGTIQTGMGNIAGLTPFSTVFISNNVPYIEALEHGHSNQAPEGMLDVTLEELRQMFP